MQDQRRFNLPSGYYEAVAEREAEARRGREAARRAGRTYRDDAAAGPPPGGEARPPPPPALPAPVRGCWVGGVAVPARRPPTTVSV